MREAFTIRDESGRVQEQIDGLIALDGRPILVEAKWLSTPIGQGENLAGTWCGCMDRAEVMGLFVSSSPYTDAAIAECKTVLSQRVIVVAEVNEIVMLLEDPDAKPGRLAARRRIMAAKRGAEAAVLPRPEDPFCVTRTLGTLGVSSSMAVGDDSSDEDQITERRCGYSGTENPYRFASTGFAGSMIG